MEKSLKSKKKTPISFYNFKFQIFFLLRCRKMFVKYFICNYYLKMQIINTEMTIGDEIGFQFVQIAPKPYQYQQMHPVEAHKSTNHIKYHTPKLHKSENKYINLKLIHFSSF